MPWIKDDYFGKWDFSRSVVIENIIREVKIFRIIAEKYRNGRKRFALRFNLIAAIYNLNLEYKWFSEEL